MLPDGSARPCQAFVAPSSLALLPASLGGYTTTTLERSMQRTVLPAVHEEFEAALREPLNARAHIQTSRDLLARGARTRADIELAKCGFQTAARLTPDLWEDRKSTRLNSSH